MHYNRPNISIIHIVNAPLEYLIKIIKLTKTGYTNKLTLPNSYCAINYQNHIIYNHLLYVGINIGPKLYVGHSHTSIRQSEQL